MRYITPRIENHVAPIKDIKHAPLTTGLPDSLLPMLVILVRADSLLANSEKPDSISWRSSSRDWCCSSNFCSSRWLRSRPRSVAFLLRRLGEDSTQRAPLLNQRRHRSLDALRRRPGLFAAWLGQQVIFLGGIIVTMTRTNLGCEIGWVIG